jgi:4'-phosphopantetheinyl transferase
MTQHVAAGIELEAGRLRSEAHVWLALPEQIRDPQLAQRYWDVLADEERARAVRFRFAKHRHTFVVAHALLRSCLSSYADVAPAQWSFAANPHGRPHLAGPAGMPELRFNLSHTSGLVACAVARERDVGCDVEDLGRSTAILELAERYFAAAELAELRRLPAERQRTRFFEYWTLKEAYLKARGVGLRLALDGFAFDVSGPGQIGVTFSDAVPDDAQRWQFELQRPTLRHVLALAIKRPSVPLEIRVRTCVPLVPRAAEPDEE